jgi:hypothetical protein
MKEAEQKAEQIVQQWINKLSDFADSYRCLCARNYPGSTEYHGHDCQSAVVQEFVVQFKDKIHNEP